MREYNEQEKEKEKKSDRKSEKLENEFQPESRFEEKDDLGNNFVPSDENPYNTDKLDSDFEPIDDAELKPKSKLSIHPDEFQRIKDEKLIEEKDKKYIKEWNGDNERAKKSITINNILTIQYNQLTKSEKEYIKWFFENESRAMIDPPHDTYKTIKEIKGKINIAKEEKFIKSGGAIFSSRINNDNERKNIKKANFYSSFEPVMEDLDKTQDLGKRFKLIEEKSIEKPIIKLHYQEHGQKKEELLGDQRIKREQEENAEMIITKNKKIELVKEIEEEYEEEINANELILLYNSESNLYKLTEIKNAKIKENCTTFGFNVYSKQPSKVNVSEIKKLPKEESLNIICKHGILSVSKDHSLFTVDDDLNITEIKAKDIKEGIPILMPRNIEVKINKNPIDLSNCGKIIKEDNVEYVKEARTKAKRFINKNSEVGFILGQYCAEGSMKYLTITCNTNQELVNKVGKLVEKNFAIKPFISKNKSNRYKTMYFLRSDSNLAKKIFTKGLNLEPKLAPYKEVPPFLYNAPIDCVNGFLLGFFKGDGSVGDYTRNNSPSRDVTIRLNSSSKKLVFGLSFLLKRLNINTIVSKREFDNEKHPTWHDNYSLTITGKRNLNILRKFIPNLPNYSKFARDRAPDIDLNPWIKKLNTELKEKYNRSLRMLVEKKKIPSMAARCAQDNNMKNISENNLLKTLNYLEKNHYRTPTMEKLSKTFHNNTFTKVKKIEKNLKQDNIYHLSIPKNKNYIAGIGQIYIKN